MKQTALSKIRQQNARHETDSGSRCTRHCHAVPDAWRRGTWFAWKCLCTGTHCLFRVSHSADWSLKEPFVSWNWHLPLFLIMGSKGKPLKSTRGVSCEALHCRPYNVIGRSTDVSTHVRSIADNYRVYFRLSATATSSIGRGQWVPAFEFKESMRGPARILPSRASKRSLRCHGHRQQIDTSSARSADVSLLVEGAVEWRRPPISITWLSPVLPSKSNWIVIVSKRWRYFGRPACSAITSSINIDWVTLGSTFFDIKLRGLRALMIPLLWYTQL